MGSVSIVGLVGLRGVGKTTVANVIAEYYRFDVLAFAATLKSMLISAGVPFENVYGDKKEVPLEMLCGMTARHAMQTLGTEWGRDCIGANIWANLWIERAKARLKTFDGVVADDCRFPNEFQAIKEMGGVIVRLRSKNREVMGDIHESERYALEFRPDAELWLDGSRAESKQAVRACMDQLL
jgi:hypothetical protein